MNSFSLTVFYPGEPGLYSIRRVSEALVHKFPPNICIKEYTLPGKNASIKSIISNILFVWKHRNTKGYNYLTIQSYCILGLLGCKKIITVHDLNPIYGILGRKDNYIKKKIVYLFWVYLPIVLTSKITCVSNYTKKQCFDYVSHKDMKVVYNMLHPSFENIPHEIFRMPKHEKVTALLVDTSKQKNIETLFKAVSGLDVRLNIIGRLSQQQIELLEDNDIEYSNFFQHKRQ